ncbi:hypothetical protein F8388_026363 [Cannabis sativa]|uniref:WAT1-related protein n=1 Tax=Cannabis sativa TaxID=3483 RepID=A0A7J6E3B3_CANSA|nr:hypothetical protein F8388_026363 [Cannabis sativa]
MGGFDEYKPAMAMFGLQFSYAGVALSTRAALLQGMSPSVFVFYRQAIATLVIAPFAYFTRKKSGGSSMGLRSFSLIFLVSLIGLEKVNIRSLRSLAKILGTIVCVSGAMSMALVKGPKLLNLPNNNDFVLGSNMSSSSNDHDHDWILGCIFLFGAYCCWSTWLILQVPASACCPNHLCLAAWMCFMGTIQSAIIAFFLEKDSHSWKFTTALEFGSCFFSGVFGSGVSFFVQAWVISQRGPLFSAIFNPLCTIIVTILAAIFLHEKIYTGGLVGAIGVIIGLYILLWGKAKDIKNVIKEEIHDPNLHKNTVHEQRKQHNIDDDYMEKGSHRVDLEEPLLSDHANQSFLT